jgi:hypothetical protein
MMSTTAITLAHLRALVTYVRDIRFQRVCLSGFKAPSDRHPPPNIVDAVIKVITEACSADDLKDIPITLKVECLGIDSLMLKLSCYCNSLALFCK